MADQDITHITEIMKAALPYLDSGTKGPAEFFVKIFDLLGGLKSMKSSNNLAACGFTTSKIDMEGLLTGIRPVCNNKEREFIDRILGFFSMKKMFEMYNNLMETMKTMQEFGGFNFNDDGTDNDTENVTGSFASSGFESIFKNFQNINSAASASDSQEQNTEANKEQHQTKDSDKNDAPMNGNGFGKPNDMMFDMLKTMIPPEQMSTFENLSMLLKTMSYDDNSKSDSKESNDG